MARRGLPIADGVKEMTTDATTMTLSHRSRHYKPQQIYIAQTLHKYMSRGATLSEAMSQTRRLFQPFECAMVRAGEQAGNLPDALEALKIFARRASHRKQHFSMHIMYPLVLMIMVTLITAFIFIKVFPRFSAIYNQLDAGSMPGLTVWIITTFSMLFYERAIEWVVFAVCFAMLLIFCRDIFYFVPVLGGWLRQNRLGQILMMLGMQLRGGVPMDEALGVLAKMKGGLWSRRVGRRLCEALPQGRGLGEALQSLRLLPRGVAAPVILAEQSGNIPETLIEVGWQLQDQADARFLDLIRTIEPLLILIISLVTGIVIISIYLPIFGLAFIAK